MIYRMSDYIVQYSLLALKSMIICKSMSEEMEKQTKLRHPTFIGNHLLFPKLVTSFKPLKREGLERQ